MCSNGDKGVRKSIFIGLRASSAWVCKKFSFTRFCQSRKRYIHLKGPFLSISPSPKISSRGRNSNPVENKFMGQLQGDYSNAYTFKNREKCISGHAFSVIESWEDAIMRSSPTLRHKTWYLFNFSVADFSRQEKFRVGNFLIPESYMSRVGKVIKGVLKWSFPTHEKLMARNAPQLGTWNWECASQLCSKLEMYYNFFRCNEKNVFAVYSSSFWSATLSHGKIMLIMQFNLEIISPAHIAGEIAYPVSGALVKISFFRAFPKF